MTETNLNKIFKPPIKIDRPLPKAFDKTCKGRDCGRSMKQVPCRLWGDVQPYVTFHCAECNIFLYIFPAEPDLVVWGDTMKGAISVSKRIGELLKERAQHEHRRKIRYGE